MSRLPSDLLPSYPSNQSGQQAPVTRLRLGVPKGVNLTGEERQQVEDEIFKRYRNQSRQQLETFRQMRNASTIELAAQRRKLDEFVSAKYYSHQGLEYYTLTVSEELVAEILEEKLNVLCLLIIHSGGIKAVRMADVYRKQFDVEYESSNGGDTGKTFNTQQQLTKQWSYTSVLGLLTTTEVGRGDSGGGGQIFNGSATDAEATIYFESQTVLIDVVNSTSSVTETVDPTDVWAITEDGERKKKETEDNTSPTAPYYGTKKITYYFEQSKIGEGTRDKQAPTVIKKVWDYDKHRDKVWEYRTLSDWEYGPSQGCLGNGYARPIYTTTEQHTDEIKERFDGVVTYHKREEDDGVEPQQKYWVRERVETHGPVSLDLLVMFSNPTAYIFGFLVSSGGVGKHYTVVASEERPESSSTYYPVTFNWGIGPVPNASNVMSSTFDGIYLYGPTDWWVELYNTNFCGAHHISTEITYDGPFSSDDSRKTKTVINPKKVVVPYRYPYAVDEKIYKRVETIAEDDSSTFDIETPYGPLVEGAEWVTFYGWLNLSDAGVLIQGCYVNTPSGYVYGLYIDGDKYDSVAGVPVSQISTMVLNVPLDWIKQQF